MDIAEAAPGFFAQGQATRFCAEVLVSKAHGDGADEVFIGTVEPVRVANAGHLFGQWGE